MKLTYWIALGVLLAASVGYGADKGIHIPPARKTGLMWNMSDSKGFNWDINNDGNVNDGTNDAYDGGLLMRINGSGYSGFSSARLNEAGDEIEIGPWKHLNLSISRRIFVNREMGYCRWIDIFENNTSSEVTATVQYYSNMGSSTQQAITSSGKTSVTGEDWAVVTASSNSSSPAVAHIYGAPKSKIKPIFSFNMHNDDIYHTITLKVPARKALAICLIQAQRRPFTAGVKFMKEFDFKKEMRLIPPALRKIIINMPRSGFMPDDIDLIRSGVSDTIVLANEDEDTIFGKIMNEEFTIDAFYGEIKLQAKQILGFAAAKGREDVVWAMLVGGQIVSGKLTSGPLKFSLPTGGDLEIPLSRISQCTYQITKAKPEESEFADPLILLRSGDRLAFDPAELECTFATRHGDIPLVGKDLLEVNLMHAEGGVHRVTFLNGSTLAGLLGPERISLPTRLGPRIDIARDMILSIRFAAETKDDVALSRVQLTNDDELFGRLADKEFGVVTEFGTLTVRPGNIVAMTFDAKDPSRVVVRLWDKSVLRGRLQQQTLRFAVTPGPALDLHVGQITALVCSDATPPDEIVKQVEKHIAALSAASFKDREEAQAALIRMGKSIVPLLKKHVKDTDPEVRQRVGAVLEQLGADATTGAVAVPDGGELIIGGRRLFIR